MPDAAGHVAFNQRRFYAAHEHWEAVWRAAPPSERPYYQSLIQLAAACLKIERGEYGPAVSLLQRAQAALAEPRFADTPLALQVRTLMDRLEALGPDRLDEFPPTWFPRFPEP